ncbi:helix-turn-helix domain-containing protein [Candidatus Peregrinibacteria bacterium]|nr:helix-turn-helix domain-containing protein [Candidatus Peregrinibacteria bacterium]
MNKLKFAFGQFLKTLRMDAKITLREICKRANADPSNWSKMERGLLSPPKDKQILEKWAKLLLIEKGSENWSKFFELAELAHGNIPKDIISDAELVRLLPAFFRTLRGQKPTKEDIKKIIDLIKNA